MRQPEIGSVWYEVIPAIGEHHAGGSWANWIGAACATGRTIRRRHADPGNGDDTGVPEARGWTAGRPVYEFAAPATRSRSMVRQARRRVLFPYRDSSEGQRRCVQS